MLQKIKILMVTSQYPPDLNGAALQCMRVVKALRSRIDIAVLTSPPSNKSSFLSSPNVYRVLDFKNIFLIIISILQAGFIMLKCRFDIVHFHGYSKKTLPLCLIAKLIGARVILKLTSYGYDDLNSIINRGLIHKYCLSLIDGYIYPSPAFKLFLDNKKFHYSSKMFFIPNGVDLNKFRPSTFIERREFRRKHSIDLSSFVILLVGHFSIDKGFEDVVNAINLIESKQAKITLVFIGSRDLSHFEVSAEVVEKLNEFERKRDKSWIDIKFIEKTEEIETFFQCSDLYILSSRREGLPNALLEAMACMVPVISTKLIGITDFIIESEVNGILYEAGDHLNLSIAIEKVRRDYKYREKLARQGQEKISRYYNIFYTSDSLFKTYLSLI